MSKYEPSYLLDETVIFAAKGSGCWKKTQGSETNAAYNNDVWLETPLHRHNSLKLAIV